MPQPVYVQVAVPTPLRRSFTYLVPASIDPRSLTPGCRVTVPFGRRKLVGIVLSISEHTEQDRHRLKAATQLLDTQPLWPDEMWNLLLWSAQYYQHPLGDVLHTAMPALLRQGRAAEISSEKIWHLTQSGRTAMAALSRAPRQLSILQRLAHATDGLRQEDLLAENSASRDSLKRLQEKDWIRLELRQLSPGPAQRDVEAAPVLHAEQAAAVTAISAAFDQYRAFLLEGITGSGKTEVYLQLIAQCVAREQQALVLIPEIGLTPQMIRRFEKRLSCAIAVLHSGLTDNERLAAWLAAKAGRVAVVLGTRSAIFTPLDHYRRGTRCLVQTAGRFSLFGPRPGDLACPPQQHPHRAGFGHAVHRKPVQRCARSFPSAAPDRTRRWRKGAEPALT